MLWLALLALFGRQSLEDRHAELLKHRAARPETAGPAHDAWEKRRFDLEWEYGTALSRLAHERKSPDLHRQVIRHFTEFIWVFDDYIAALQARVVVARSHEALGEWGACFDLLRHARRTETPELRKHPEAVEIATRALAVELRARVAHGRSHEISLQAAQLHLRQFPKETESEPFVAMRIELGRALHAAGKRSEGERLLREVDARHPEGEALEALASLFARPEDLARWADRLFERNHFTEAVIAYRSLAATPRVWLRIGLCYFHLRRFHEAAFALEQVLAKEGPERIEAAVRLEQVLRRLGDAAKLAAHRAWMAKSLDLSKIGPATVMVLADGLLSEGKYAEAADLYGKIRSGEEGHEEAVHATGYCRFRLREYEKAVEAFRCYLAFEKRRERSTGAAIDLACASLLALGRADDLLAFTEKRVPRDAALAQWRLAHRVDAFARLGRFAEAHETLASMNESAALRAYIRGLERLAAGYEQALRKGGDRKLWGPYARLVVTLSEKTYQPLRGERLLAAADALALEGTAEGQALAYDLYSNYLLTAPADGREKIDIEHRRARAAFGAGKLERALEIAVMLCVEQPGSGSFRELRADIVAAQADRLPAGAERAKLLDEAVEIYRDLSGALLVGGSEHAWRLLWKYASRLSERRPEAARDFFIMMEKRGYGAWDEDAQGYRTKMQALRAKVMKAVPPRR
jgi:tetratricopeptide (TPR) repeat protein